MRRLVTTAAAGGLLALGVAPAAAAAQTAATATPAGVARAVSAKASATVTVSRLRVLVAAPARAEALHVGIYDGRTGHPGRLLASGRTTRVGAGWATASLPAVRLVKGRRYWLAVLAQGGTLRTRGARSGCHSERGPQRGLHRLPPRWRVGKASSRCAVRVAALAGGGAASGTAGTLPLSTPGAAGAGAATGTTGPSAPGGTAGTAGGTGAATPPAPGPATPSPSAPLPAGATLGRPAATAVAAAKSAPFLRFGRSYPGGAYVNDGWGGGASMVLATASYAGDASTDARLLAQVRDLIAGGNEPVANGGYPAQHERWVTAMLVLVRRTPRVWNALSDAERKKIDLVMAGALVASAFTTSDSNPYVKSGAGQVTLDGDTDVNRDWNPNYREGMVGMMLVGAAYFGGATGAQGVLDGYDAPAFLAALRANGLSNQAATFSWKADHPSSAAPTAAAVQAAVKGYRYHGLRLDQTMAVARALTVNTYVARVSCGLNGGAGITTSSGPAGVIVSGCSGLPNQGAAGMLQELDGVDGGGSRSSAHYAYDGFRVNQNDAIVLLASGLWSGGADADEIKARLRIGVPDLWYKLGKGYRGYASGSLQYIEGAPSPGVLRDDNPNFGFPYSRTLWNDVLRPALGL